MTLTALVSATGSPGVTTTALAFGSVWPVDHVVIEADPAGGVLANRFQMQPAPGLAGMAVAGKRGGPLTPNEIWANSQELPGQVPVCFAPDSADLVRSALIAGGQSLANGLAGSGIDVIVDAGRIQPGSPALPLITTANVILMVTRPTVEALRIATYQMQHLSTIGAAHTVGWLLIGDRPYTTKEIEAAYGYPVFGVIADDPKGAAALRGDGTARSWRRSPIQRTAAAIVEQLTRHAYPTDTPTPAAPVAVEPVMNGHTP